MPMPNQSNNGLELLLKKLKKRELRDEDWNLTEKQAHQEAPRIKGFIIREELPRKYAKILNKRKDKDHKIQRYFRALTQKDAKIYIHKYYPWCYLNYMPIVILQGWYNPDKAKKAYLRIYGPKALDYIRFIKGKEALAKGFKIGKSLYINGRWRFIPGKSSMFPFHLHRMIKKLFKSIPGKTIYDKRTNLDKEIPYYQNGSREIIFIDKSIKKARLQKVQKIKTQRKKDLYIE